jgi:hypothetical protein
LSELKGKKQYPGVEGASPSENAKMHPVYVEFNSLSNALGFKSIGPIIREICLAFGKKDSKCCKPRCRIVKL